MKIKQSESSLLKQVIQYLELNKIRYRRRNTGVARFSSKSGKTRFVKFGQKGDADLTIFIGPLSAEVELKTLTGEQTEEQMATEKEIKADGGLYFLVRNIETMILVVEYLQRINWKITI